MKAFIVCFFLGCTSGLSAQSSIMGIWQFDVQASLNGDNIAKARYDSLPSTSKSRITETFDSRKFSFLEGGDMAISWWQNGAEKKVLGTYSYNDSSKKMSMVVLGRETIFNVLTLTDSNLVLEGPSTGGLFHKIHFRRSE